MQRCGTSLSLAFTGRLTPLAQDIKRPSAVAEAVAAALVRVSGALRQLPLQPPVRIQPTSTAHMLVIRGCRLKHIYHLRNVSIGNCFRPTRLRRRSQGGLVWDSKRKSSGAISLRSRT